MPPWITAVAAGKPYKWFDIRAEAEGGTVRLDINGPIGWDGVSADDVIQALGVHKAATRIDVHLSSPGGSAFDGVQIYNNLRRHPAQVHVMVDGYAASAGSIIAMAGDEIVMGQGSMMMIHNARGSVYGGSAEDMEVAATLLRKSNTSMANIYSRRAGGSPDAWLQVMAGEQWYTAEEAVDANLATRVEDYDREDDDSMAAVAELGVARFGWRYPGRDTAPAPVSIASLEVEKGAPAQVTEPEPVPDPFAELQAWLDTTPESMLAAWLADQEGQ